MADSKEEQSWFSQAWDWTRNSLLGRTIGIDDATKAGKESKGLWGETKDLLGIGSSDETKGKSAEAEENKSWFSQAWDWTRNSLLGRTIGIDDATKAGKESKGLWGETKDLLGIGSSKETDEKGAAKQTESKGLWGWMKNSLLGRTFGLADEGNNEPGLWGWMKNSMLGRTFGLEDKGNDKPGLWGWMKNSMLGRALGLADKKEATANTATAQQTQAPQQKTATVSNQQTNTQQVQRTSNGAIIDDVIVEHSTVNAPKAAAKAAAPKAAAPKTPAKEAAPKKAAPNTATKEAASNIRLEDIGSEFGAGMPTLEAASLNITAPRLLDPSVSEVTLGYNPKTSGTTLIDANESSNLCSLLNTITAVRNGTTVDGFGLNPLDTKTVGDNAGLGAVPNIAGIYLGDKAR